MNLGSGTRERSTWQGLKDSGSLASGTLGAEEIKAPKLSSTDRRRNLIPPSHLICGRLKREDQ